MLSCWVDAELKCETVKLTWFYALWATYGMQQWFLEFKFKSTNICECLLHIKHSIQFYEAIEDKQDGVPSLEVLWSKVRNWVSAWNDKKKKEKKQW